MENQAADQLVGTGREWVERAASAIEYLAVALIVLVIAYATVAYLLARLGRDADGRAALGAYRSRLGQGLLLGLEILVAADVVRTVALAPTLQNVFVLGLLVVIRTFLSWSLEVELEGHWPWRGAGCAGAGSDAEPAA